MERQRRTAADRTKLVRRLNDLIHLDLDAAKAYQTAIDRLDDLTSRQKLEEFMVDHTRHVDELQRLVRDLGGTPTDRADAKRILTQGRVFLQSIRGDRGILQAMRSNEDETNEKYESALEMIDLPPDVRQVLAANLSDERRHRAWIIARLEEL